MGDSLDFSLGLATSSFLNPLSLVSGKVAAFISTTVGAGAIISGVFSAIERGSRLDDLSARLGESSRNLYLLERGFNRVGIGGEVISGIVLRMQQNFSGLSAGGERVSGAFAQLGLSMEAIKKLDTPQQLNSIFRAMQGLDRNQATGIATAIFGRGGAGDILQAARGADEFAEAIQKFSRGAELVGRTTAAFDQVSNRINEIKEQVKLMFVGLAEGALPAIETVLTKLEGIDFIKLGQDFGRVFGIAGQAIKEGRFFELISQSIGAAAEKGFAVMQNVFGDSKITQTFFDAMATAVAALEPIFLRVIETATLAFQVGMDLAVQKFFETDFGKGLGIVLGWGDMGGFTASSPAELIEERRREGKGFFTGHEGEFKRDTDAQLALAIKQFSDGLKLVFKDTNGPEQEKLRLLINELAANLIKVVPGQEAAKAGAAAASLDGPLKFNDANSLERIGAIFGAGGGGSSDLKGIRDNTGQLVREVKKLNDKNGRVDPDFANR